jgi:uncharacterized cupredoxin-like copper-binding protein
VNLARQMRVVHLTAGILFSRRTLAASKEKGMFKLTALLLAAVAGVVIASGTAYAQEKTHEGKVVSVSDGKLVMADNDGKNEHTHEVGMTAKVTLDGKDAKLTDLQKNDRVRVSQDTEGKVVAIVATRKGT